MSNTLAIPKHVARAELNEKHMRDPQPGDYWHEMFTPILLVVRVNGPLIEYVDRDHLVPKGLEYSHFGTSKPMHEGTWMTLMQKLSYSSKPGTPWCDVIPGRVDLAEDVLERYGDAV